MKRLGISLAALLATLALGAAPAGAAAPTVGATSATDIQGTSALLKGEINPCVLLSLLPLRAGYSDREAPFHSRGSLCNSRRRIALRIGEMAGGSQHD